LTVRTRTNGNAGANKILDQDKAAHDWYRFVLSFPPQLVQKYLLRFSIDERHLVLDPFCGTGTTLVECKKRRIPASGVEATLMGHYASRVKTDWSVDAMQFLEHAEHVAARVADLMESQGQGEFGDLPLFRASSEATIPADLKTLDKNQWAILSKDFISPVPLHRALTLLDEIMAGGDERFVALEKLALAKTLVTEVGNVSFGPEIGRSAPKKDAPVVTVWLSLCRNMAEDLVKLQDRANVPSTVLLGDSRERLPMKENSIDAVITSPPYPNEKDYTRTTRLESVVLGLVKNRSELRRMKVDLLRSNTRNVFVADDDDRWVEEFESVQQLAREIERRRIELGKTSGFERQYHRVVRLYFGGMKRHLDNLRPFLRPGARCAYVVGDQMSYLLVHIKTGEILAEIASALGYEVEGIELWRTRLATATKEQLREEVVVLRWPGQH